MTDRRTTDAGFLSLVSSPELRSVAVQAAGREGLRRDVARIASAAFCGAGIDRSIISFAIRRTAAHWGLTEDAVDVLVAARLLTTAAVLAADLYRLAADHPVTPAAEPAVA